MGTLGLIFPYTQPYFKLASAFNLWVSLILLLLFHQEYNRSFILTAIGIFLAGFFIEVMGVHTGVIFGKYWYGQTLGTKVLDVPLVIGANWLLLIYCSSIIAENIFNIIKKKIPENYLRNSVGPPTDGRQPRVPLYALIYLPHAIQNYTSFGVYYSVACLWDQRCMHFSIHTPWPVLPF